MHAGNETFEDPQMCLNLEGSEDTQSESSDLLEFMESEVTSQMPFSNGGDAKETQSVFDGSALNKLQVICLLLRMYVQHKISFKAMDSFLELLNFTLPKLNCIPKSWYRMKQYISEYLPKVIIMLYFWLIIVAVVTV